MTGIFHIRKSAALILVWVFALSFTPRQWLHDLVLDHRDEQFTELLPGVPQPKQQIHHHQFNCGMVLQHTLPAFLAVDFAPDFRPPYCRQMPAVLLPEVLTKADFDCFAHRGPPYIV
ncbi:hypothetical protein [Niabella terrae]